MRRGWLLILLLLIGCGGPAGTISVEDPWLRPTGPATATGHDGHNSAGNSAAYLTIRNGATADRLLRVETDDAASAEVHETIIVDNVARMEPVGALEIPANGSVELRPGGYHIMLTDVRRQLAVGESVEITLVFEHAGEVQVQASVQELGGAQ